MNPDGQGQFGSHGATLGVLDRAHGEVVFERATIMTKSLGYNQVSTGIGSISQPWLVGVDHWQGQVLASDPKPNDLYLVKIDTKHYQTDSILQGIRDAIAFFQSGGMTLSLTNGQQGSEQAPVIKRFVINMSFAIIPCDPFTELGADPNAVLNEYDNNLKNDPEFSQLRSVLDVLAQRTVEQNLVARGLWQANPDRFPLVFNIAYPLNKPQILEWPRQDPIYKMAKEIKLPDDLTLFYVASAGNFGDKGYKFPFAPALWDFVLSASATENNSLAHYSNWGEVRMDGTFTDNQNRTYTGTSFSAPQLSVQAAVYLAHGGAILCNNLTPPLNYVSESRMDWQNLPLPDAVGTFCKEFLTH